ncbi:chromosomal replication initiator protein DnaA [Spirochaetia bacterium]|nr:chromosomal replication initiator protein DnaA [Spirochaetia bacterium]
MAEWDDYKIFWRETLSLIKREKGEQEFAMWFNLEFLKATENQITLGVPSSFYRDQVKQRYQDYIEAAIKNLTGKDISLVFEVKPKTVEENPARESAGDAQNAEKTVSPAVKASVKEKKSGHSQLNKDYTFDKYVIGTKNSFAANATMAAAKNPGISYSPLLIYGGVGLGKTHLMQAIGNYIYENSDRKIIYTTAENFMNEFVDMLSQNQERKNAFKNKYRYNVDVLLIDDIHFFEKKDSTQEELFHIFNELHNAKKQIVFTCDRPVQELKNLTERLKSRFEQGLNVELEIPDFETRCAILKNKAESRKISIPVEVISLVSRQVSSNVRDLESALTKLIAYAELVGKPITVEITQQLLKNEFASPKQINMSIDTIQRVVADYFSLSLTDLKGKKRNQNIVFPRQLAMYISQKMTEYSTTEIGQDFGGKDHTTVMHSCSKIEERIKADPTLDSTIQTLIRTIKETSAKS